MQFSSGGRQQESPLDGPLGIKTAASMPGTAAAASSSCGPRRGSSPLPGILTRGAGAATPGLGAASSGAGTSSSPGSSRSGANRRMQSLQSLLHLRGEIAILQDLKLGPVLGRGSYGRVHRARWKSAVVAVKIIEHHGEGEVVSSGGRKINVGRETLLATTMSHPNVVQTYHISTMTVRERTALTQRLLRNKESSREQQQQVSFNGV